MRDADAKDGGGASPQGWGLLLFFLCWALRCPTPHTPLPAAGRAHATHRCLACIYVTSEFSFSGSLSGIARPAERLQESRKPD